VRETNIPACLKGLTDVEEQLIARVKAVMSIRWTRGRQLQYKDHIINFRQDIRELAQKLPRLPQDLDMVIIRRPGVDMTQHVDYMVRREKVRDALLWKIMHDPAYRDLEVDEAALAALPENGTVVHMIPTCAEGAQAQAGAAMPAGPAQAASEGNDDGPEEFIGGLHNVGISDQTEVVAIRERAEDIVQDRPRYEQTIVSYSYLFQLRDEKCPLTLILRSINLR
jgi:hypothetical protein